MVIEILSHASYICCSSLITNYYLTSDKNNTLIGIIGVYLSFIKYCYQDIKQLDTVQKVSRRPQQARIRSQIYLKRGAGKYTCMYVGQWTCDIHECSNTFIILGQQMTNNFKNTILHTVVYKFQSESGVHMHPLPRGLLRAQQNLYGVYTIMIFTEHTICGGLASTLLCNWELLMNFTYIYEASYKFEHNLKYMVCMCKVGVAMMATKINTPICDDCMQARSTQFWHTKASILDELNKFIVLTTRQVLRSPKLAILCPQQRQ